jgi:hypothetical protein
VTGAYLAFLVARDGAPDMARHTLARREELFERLAGAPLRSRRGLDHACFDRNLARRRPEAGLDRRMLWLLATAKANQAERFGVGLAELYGKVDVDDPVRVHLALQEHYHTRILGDVVAVFGLTARPRPPALVARALVRLLVATPEPWTRPLTGCAEMVGCLVFRALRDAGVELFADEPAVAGRIALIYDEILGDEIGHVGYVASLLGPGGRRLMRGLYRALGFRLGAQIPELVALVGRPELRRRFRAAFRLEEMAAALPGRAYVVATI